VDLQWFGLVGNHDWAARTWDLFSRILARSYSTVAIRKDATSLTTLKEKLIKIGCRKKGVDAAGERNLDYGPEEARKAASLR
jgi:hypothetical protein